MVSKNYEHLYLLHQRKKSAMTQCGTYVVLLNPATQVLNVREII